MESQIEDAILKFIDYLHNQITEKQNNRSKIIRNLSSWRTNHKNNETKILEDFTNMTINNDNIDAICEAISNQIPTNNKLTEIILFFSNKSLNIDLFYLLKL